MTTTVYALDGKLYCRQHAPSGATSRRLREGETITCDRCHRHLVGAAPSGPHTCRTCGKPLTPADRADDCADCYGEWVRGEREKGQPS